MSKLILWGVAFFIVTTFWTGSQDNKKTQAQTEHASGSTTTESVRIQTPVVQPVSQTAAASERAYKNESEPYVREVDPGSASTYSYRVDGENAYGEYVHGMVNTRGTSGSGYVRNDDRDLFWIKTTWTENGDLLGSDDQGNTYVLTTSEVR